MMVLYINIIYVMAARGVTGWKCYKDFFLGTTDHMEQRQVRSHTVFFIVF